MHAHMALDPLEDLCLLEGFDHVVHRAEFEAKNDVLVQISRRAEDDGDVRRRSIGFETPADLVTIHFWHGHVQQNQIGKSASRIAQRHLPIRSQQHLVALALEHMAQHIEIGQLIVDEQNLRGLRHGSSSVP